MKIFIALVAVCLTAILTGCESTPENKPHGNVMIGNFTIFNPKHRDMLETRDWEKKPKEFRDKSRFFSNLDGSYTSSYNRTTTRSDIPLLNPMTGGVEHETQDTTSVNAYENYTPIQQYFGYGQMRFIQQLGGGQTLPATRSVQTPPVQSERQPGCVYSSVGKSTPYSTK